MKKSIVLFALTLLPLCAQEIKFPASFDRLAEKASETVNVSLDGSTLQMAGKFLSSNKRCRSQGERSGQEPQGDLHSDLRVC